MKDKTFHPHMVTCRQKGFSEFMWQSCFSYYKKGPYYIQEDKTKEEKKAAKEDLIVRNAIRYNLDHANWLST